MKIMGFNFNKVSAEKNSEKINNLKVDAHIDISEIKKASADFLKTKEEVVIAMFKYILEYTPSIAKIELAGTVALSLDQKESKEIFEQWQDKKLPVNIKIPLYNLILRKSTIKAFQLEEELNLPLHAQGIPSLKPVQENKK